MNLHTLLKRLTFRDNISLLNTRKALLASIFLLLAACDKPNNDNQNEITSILTRAESYLAQGQIRASMIEAKNALQAAPEKLETHILLARISNKVGQYKTTTERLESINNPEFRKNLEYVLVLGEAYIALNKYYSAQELLENSKEAGFQNPEYHLLLAQCYRGIKKHQQAKSSVKRAIDLSKDDAQTQALAYTELAYINAQNKDLDAANSNLDTALQIKPLPITLMGKAALSYQKEDFDDTEDYLSKALIEIQKTDIITPERAKVLRALIQVLSKLGRSSEALIYSKVLSEASPNSEKLEASLAKAVELYREGKLQESEEILREVYSEAPNEFGGKLLGLINAMQGDYLEADTYLSEHVDPETASGKAINLLAKTKLELNQTEDALLILKEKIAQTPDDPAVLSIYGQALLRKNKTKEGIQYIEKALKLNPKDTNLTISLANVFKKQGDSTKAQSLLENAYQQNKLDEKVSVALSAFYLSTIQIKLAKSLSHEILQNVSQKAYPHAIAAMVAKYEKNTEKTVKHFNQALKIEPKNIALSLGLSLAHIHNSEPKKALTILSDAQKTEGNNPTIYKTLITAHEVNGTPDKALLELEQTSQENLQLWAPYSVLAEYYLRRGDLDQALKYSVLALERSNNNAYSVNIALEVHNIRSARAIANKDYGSARDSSLSALQLQPNNLFYLGRLASIEIRDDAIGEADKIISQIESLYPKSTLPIALKGDIALVKESPQKALELYRSAWGIQPSDPLGNKIVKVMKLLNQDPTTFLDEWVGKLPDNPNALLTKGLTLHQQGETKEAMKTYEQLLTVSPNSLAGINNLAWLRYENGDQGALELAQKGAKLYPQNPSMLDTYGWILFNQGDKQRAKEILKKALDLDPENEEIKSHYNEASH